MKGFILMEAKPQRLLSLDLFRGLIMFLLVSESTRLYETLKETAPESSVFYTIVMQFHHHPWHGLRFWDLVQPYFMFIVGVAMVFSLTRRRQQGATWESQFRHILKRCLILFFLGVLLHCGYRNALVWELWNVLTQLSFTIMVSFLLFNLRPSIQLSISILFLVITEILYRTFSVEGFNQAFIMGHNFGSWMDTVLMGKINGGGWVAINCLPTTAHTMWGVLAGKFLMSDTPVMNKVKQLALFGLSALALGYGLDWTGITPIIKRICTSSFVLASGGWCLLTLALFYWLVDIKGFKRGILFFAIVGMNPIFIYMFSEAVGKAWFNGYVGIFSNGFMQFAGMPESLTSVITSLVTLACEWYLCYWLYKRKVFIKI
jgi:predicted acyltransferase